MFIGRGCLLACAISVLLWLALAAVAVLVWRFA